MLSSCLEHSHRICDAKGKKGMVLYKDAEDNRVLFATWC